MPSSTTTSASATSARDFSDSVRTYSPGLCAPPPRGPSPSTVTGITVAMWLASLGHPLRGRGQRAQRVAGPVGRRARVGRHAGGLDAQCRGRLALDHDALLPARSGLAGLEAQAGVEALEARRMPQASHAPFLVGHEQESDLLEGVRPRGERVENPEREDDPALHVHRPRADQPIAAALERAVTVVRD